MSLGRATNTRAWVEDQLTQRILILDGAMGTMVQALKLSEEEVRGDRFVDYPRATTFKNFVDLLCLTHPELIVGIHNQFLSAGADILQTNTFGANPISMKEFGLEHLVHDLNLAAVSCARKAIEQTSPHQTRLIAGSIGPTTKTASLPPKVEDPAYRNVTYDELAASYGLQVGALIEAGVDLLIAETTFDTLNLKACLFAIAKFFEEYKIELPVMASVTITDESGRTLGGQTVEGFWNSISHFSLLSVGINCALGPEKMRPYVEELSQIVPVYTSCHPNAGLPNPLSETGYDETPEAMAKVLGEFANNGWLNIVGGCCGTTPDHLRTIANAVRDKPTRQVATPEPWTRLSGLEPLTLRPETNFTTIGERTNVMGSKKFSRMILNEQYDEALLIAQEQVDNGANIIDVNMDEAMLDSEAAMTCFLNLISAEPEIARVPVMIDSSKWSVIEAGLKCVQGKPIVNSISLKEGEKEFLKMARLIRRYGAAVVVMAFDETGQATHVEDRVQICQRAYHLLTSKVGMTPSDIILDPNILTVATGIKEHNRYAINFIEATRQIKLSCPGAKISGGVSNISFSFRGKDSVREAMHSAFLYHAIRAGLDMGIVNAGQLTVYEDIEPTLLELVEDVLFDRRLDATERLVDFAETVQDQGERNPTTEFAWREKSLEERLKHALVRGIHRYIDEDVEEARKKYDTCLSIIEGPLMEGMNTVGDLFGSGKMFLPQVVKSARVMKKAVIHLLPYMEEQQRNSGLRKQVRGTLVIATVKGDVHDIGKNIVGVVLGCNNYRIIDLGVMVPCEKILETARDEGADIIGLSGLITPSLEEMVHVAREMERHSFEVPLLIGGATTSAKHTAVKIAPGYHHITAHVLDASRAVSVVEKLLSQKTCKQFARDNRQLQKHLVDSHAQRQSVKLVSHQTAQNQKFSCDWKTVRIDRPSFLGVRVLNDLPIAWLEPYIDWSPFFLAWELKGKYPAILQDPKLGDAARKLFQDAQELLREIVANKWLVSRGVYGFWPAASWGDDIVVFADENRDRELCRFHTLRQQWQRRGQNVFYALADFVAPRDSNRQDFLGGFAITAGIGCDRLTARFEADHDDYRAILVKSLADRLAEAFAEWLHQKVRRQWGYGAEGPFDVEDLIAENYRGIRPAHGYPACPDHTEKQVLFDLLAVKENAHITLTENFAMCPAASVSGLYLAHPEARYFAVDRITRDQVFDYARRKGIAVAEAERWLAPNLGYDPS